MTRSKQTTDGVEYGGGGDPTKWMTYEYFVSGGLWKQQYPSGRVVENALDMDGDLSLVKTKKNTGAAFANYASNFSYNAAKAITGLQLGNGLWESAQFNSRLQPEQIALGTSQNGVDKLKLNYSYGGSQNNGNVTSQTITVPSGFAATQTYNYDTLNRLDDATEVISGNQTWTQDYSYDRWGNRNIISGFGVTNLTFSGNRISNAGYSFDLAGNMTADPSGKAFTYDAENKQKTAVVGGYTNEYYYDGDGRRVKKVVPSTGETTVFVYDAFGKLVAEYSTIVGPPATAKVTYMTADHLGTPRINTDGSGSVVARHDYMPFGEEIFTALTAQRTSGVGYVGDTVRKQFTAYERDNESELDFAEARYYGYNHGRFTSPDNFLNDTHREDPASWNLYVYVRNNPLNYVDPSGEELQLVRVTDKDGKVIENIDGENRKALLGWLNTTYGCSSCVTIDKNNTIRLDTSQVSKDVLAVTTDLTNAITDKNHVAFVVGYEGNANVNFAQAQQNVAALGGRDAILVDFKDFRGLSGDKEAVSAFTNYAFVHEVFHLFPSLLKDTTSDKDVTGPVENKVNEIRQVRGAMLRASYSAESDNGIFGSMWFGRAKVDKKTGAIKRNSNGGILVDSKKLVSWNLRMTGK